MFDTYTTEGFCFIVLLIIFFLFQSIFASHLYNNHTSYSKMNMNDYVRSLLLQNASSQASCRSFNSCLNDSCCDDSPCNDDCSTSIESGGKIVIIHLVEDNARPHSSSLHEIVKLNSSLHSITSSSTSSTSCGMSISSPCDGDYSVERRTDVDGGHDDFILQVMQSPSSTSTTPSSSSPRSPSLFELLPHKPYYPVGTAGAIGTDPTRPVRPATTSSFSLSSSGNGPCYNDRVHQDDVQDSLTGLLRSAQFDNFDHSSEDDSILHPDSTANNIASDSISHRLLTPPPHHHSSATGRILTKETVSSGVDDVVRRREVTRQLLDAALQLSESL
jgi:hypothetical protein